MFHYSGNLTDDINAYEREQEEGEKNCIHCDECGEPIWDDYAYRFGEETLCENCVEGHRTRIY